MINLGDILGDWECLTYGLLVIRGLSMIKDLYILSFVDSIDLSLTFLGLGYLSMYHLYTFSSNSICYT